MRRGGEPRCPRAGSARPFCVGPTQLGQAIPNGRTLRQVIGVAMNDLPGTVFPPKDGRHAKRVGCRRVAADRGGRVLEGDEVGKVIADASGDHLDVERAAVREPRG